MDRPCALIPDGLLQGDSAHPSKPTPFRGLPGLGDTELHQIVTADLLPLLKRFPAEREGIIPHHPSTAKRFPGVARKMNFVSWRSGESLTMYTSSRRIRTEFPLLKNGPCIPGQPGVGIPPWWCVFDVLPALKEGILGSSGDLMVRPLPELLRAPSPDAEWFHGQVPPARRQHPCLRCTHTQGSRVDER